MKLRWVSLLGLVLMMNVPLVGASYVPYLEEWGIYEFNPERGETQLIYSTSYVINSMTLSPDGSTFVLLMNLGEGYDYSEIFTLKADGSGLTQLTDNEY